jgi:hypothetical protein
MNPLLAVTIGILIVATPLLGGALVHRIDNRRQERDGLPIRHRKGKPT